MMRRRWIGFVRYGEWRSGDQVNREKNVMSLWRKLRAMSLE